MWVFGTLAGMLILAGLVAPGRLGPVQRAWMRFAHLISRVTTPVFMGVTYFLVLSPTGALMRALGRNPLAHSEGGDSFWATRYGAAKRRSDLTRQF